MNSEFAALTSTTSSAAPRRRVSGSRPQTNEDVFPNFGAARSASAAISEEEFSQQIALQAFERNLIALSAAFHEDYGCELDAGSRAGLERFVRKTPMVSRPSVGAESTGQVIATWRTADGVLSLQFLDRLRFNYALTTHGEAGTERCWGAAHALTFLDEQPLAVRFSAI
jgi:hypothetical protein